jgi:hypothetical protein
MKTSYDKLRVLWIEDLPGLGVQKEDIEDFGQYFEVVKGANSSAVRSIEEYNALLVDHFNVLKDAKTMENSQFPVDIVSADYDLSKFTPGSDHVGDKNRKDSDDYAEKRSSSHTNAEQSKSLRDSGEELLQNPSYDDYDGCIINTMYLAEFNAHPCGSVVTTYQEPSKRHKCAKKLEKHLERCYQIDLSFTGKRTWETILSAGVDALRRRIEHLNKAGHIVISLSDLMAIVDNAEHEIITIRSPHALRRLPLKGLFIDVEDENKRSLAIQEWAEKLFENIVNRTSFKTALQIVDELWAFYVAAEGTPELEQLRNRRLLSDLLRKGHTGSEVDNLKELCSATESGCEVCAEIRNYRHSDDIRRLVVVLMGFRLVTYMLRVWAKLQRFELPVGFPRLIENDLWFALFPLPRNPVALPDSSPSYRDNSWEKFIGRLDLSIPDMLQGKPCSKDRKLKGLRPAERLLLKALSSDESDLVGDGKLEDSVFHKYISARLLLWGDDSEAR